MRYLFLTLVAAFTMLTFVGCYGTALNDDVQTEKSTKCGDGKKEVKSKCGDGK